MTPRSQLLLASAGSGKTFQLTSHFLALLAAGVAPERIVASTFTRKAAGEILARLFARLARAATSDAEAARLSADVGAKLSRTAALELLARAARNIQRLRVRTLDAFFVEIARASAAELGLPPDWRVGDELELERARDRALSAALSYYLQEPARRAKVPAGSGDPNGASARPNGAPSASERGVWLALLSELERGRAGRSVRSLLVRVVDESYRLHVEAQPGAWEVPDPPRGPDDEHFTAAAEFVLEHSPPRNKSGKPNGNWLKAQAKLHASAIARDFDAVLEDGLVAAAAREEPKYYGLDVPEELCEALKVLALRATAQLGGELRAQNQASARLLERYDEHLREVRRTTRRVAFDELTRTLGAGTSSAAADLALRIDGEIDHLLLDEFQDTSPAQWRVLRPIASELAADGTGRRSVFCVGDVKQSIYGWRAAEPQLLERLSGELHLEPQALDRSWRSSPVVLDAVNQVFGRMASFPGWSADEGDDVTAADFAAWFHPHVAQHPTLPGVLRVRTCAARRGKADPWPQCVDAAVECVREIRAQAPWASIGVLLRRNALAPKLVSKLRERGILASDEGGNPLTDAVSVQAALAALHWLEHPADTIARFHVASSVLGARLGLAHDSSDESYSNAHSRARRELLDLGLAEWLARWRDDVVGVLGDWEARRFGQLVELALAAGPGANAGEFVERVRRQRVEDSSSVSVKVMTIHASKGLEFDAVVLPELEARWIARADAYVARRVHDDPQAPYELLSHAGSARLRAELASGGDARLVEAQRVTRRRAMRDSLSALYVALTRARRRLDVILWSEGKSDSEPRNTAAALIRHAFELGFGDLAPSTLVFEAGAQGAEWARRDEPAGSDGVAAEGDGADAAEHVGRGEAPVLRFAPAQRARELERVSPSSVGDGGARTCAELLADASPVARRRGLRWHAWFEALEWLDTFERDESALRALAVSRGLGGEGLERDLEDFHTALEQPPLRSLLARPAGEVELWRERAYRCVIDGVLHSGVFDRVVIESGPEGPRATILDFKTGGAAVAEHVDGERYRPQMQAYAAALMRLRGLERASIRTVLVFAESGRLVEV